MRNQLLKSISTLLCLLDEIQDSYEKKSLAIIDQLEVTPIAVNLSLEMDKLTGELMQRFLNTKEIKAAVQCAQSTLSAIQAHMATVGEIKSPLFDIINSFLTKLHYVYGLRLANPAYNDSYDLEKGLRILSSTPTDTEYGRYARYEAFYYALLIEAHRAFSTDSVNESGLTVSNAAILQSLSILTNDEGKWVNIPNTEESYSARERFMMCLFPFFPANDMESFIANPDVAVKLFLMQCVRWQLSDTTKSNETTPGVQYFQTENEDQRSLTQLKRDLQDVNNITDLANVSALWEKVFHRFGSLTLNPALMSALESFNPLPSEIKSINAIPRP